MRVDKAAIGRASLIEFQNSVDTLTGYVGLTAFTGGIMVQGSDASGIDPLFRIQTNTGVERFRVTADGNVGIGTTSPDEELVVRGRDSGGNDVRIKVTQEVGYQGAWLEVEETGSGGATWVLGTESGSFRLKKEGPGIPDTLTVDTNGAVSIFGSWTNLDSNGNTLVKDAVYQAPTDGFVCAVEQDNGDNWIAGFTDANNPPTTYLLKNCNYTNRTGVSISFPVVKEQYWRVSVRVGTAYIRWLPLGSGQCIRQ